MKPSAWSTWGMLVNKYAVRQRLVLQKRVMLSATEKFTPEMKAKMDEGDRMAQLIEFEKKRHEDDHSYRMDREEQRL